MRFFYLVAAHNEQSQIMATCERLKPLYKRFPGSRTYLLNNGSTDKTWEECLAIQSAQPQQVTALHDDGSGIGVAFRMGLKDLSKRPLTRNDWIVLAAADLPFGFSDLEAVVADQLSSDSDVWIYVGSKAHSKSNVVRNWRRTLGTNVFYVLRKLILGLNTKDTQGSILVRGDVVKYLDFKSDDYFFAIEMIDRAERLGTVKELPITLEPERRASRVRLVRDGWRMFKQLVRYRLTRQP